MNADVEDAGSESSAQHRVLVFETHAAADELRFEHRAAPGRSLDLHFGGLGAEFWMAGCCPAVPGSVAEKLICDFVNPRCFGFESGQHRMGPIGRSPLDRRRTLRCIDRLNDVAGDSPHVREVKLIAGRTRFGKMRQKGLNRPNPRLLF